MASYFEELEPDYTIELPGPEGLEAIRRLMYVLKLTINGSCVVLKNVTTDEVVAISPEFETEFGYTLAEIKVLDEEDFYHANSLDMATTHAANNLAAPYNASCKNSSAAYNWYEVLGLSLIVDDIIWRVLSFTAL